MAIQHEKCTVALFMDPVSPYGITIIGLSGALSVAWEEVAALRCSANAWDHDLMFYHHISTAIC